MKVKQTAKYSSFSWPQYYHHFRNGQIYCLLTFATIETTGEEAVVYHALYSDNRIWMHPKGNFFEESRHEGRIVPRFQPVPGKFPGGAVAAGAGGLNGPQEEVPEEKAEEAAHEEQESGEPRVGLIEAQRKGEKVADKREPADKGQPDAVFVDIDFLLLQLGTIHLEVLFDPIPSAQPAQTKGGEVPQPVPERSHYQAGPGIGSHLQHRKIEDIGTERNNGRRQERADKQPPQAPGAKVRELRQEV